MSDTAFILAATIISVAIIVVLIWSLRAERQARRELAAEHLEERRQLVIRGEQALRKQAQAVAAEANAAIHEIQTEDRLAEERRRDDQHFS